jgi:nitrate reductase gamma subunit
MKTLGIILIVVGFAMFFIPGISFKTEKNIVDMGPVQINSTEKHNLDWPDYAGGIAIVAGVIILITNRKK